MRASSETFAGRKKAVLFPGERKVEGRCVPGGFGGHFCHHLRIKLKLKDAELRVDMV
jgi:hypothetical protein